jgi:hypothetical protein
VKIAPIPADDEHHGIRRDPRSLADLLNPSPDPILILDIHFFDDPRKMV